MRVPALRCAVVLAATIACAKSGETTPDTAAPATAATTPAAPAALRPSDLAGTWHGTTLATTSDSVVGRWTSVSTGNSTARLVFEGARDSIAYTSRFDGDSMISTSEPYRSPSAPTGPEVRFRSVGRLKGGKLVGTVTTVLAAKPDSVLRQSRFEASRAP